MSIDRAVRLERYRTGLRAVLDALADITDTELDQPAPDGGWTARDVTHHLADSETNGFIRLRRLIAEDDPVIVAYDQDLYARQLHHDRPIASSLAVLGAVRASSLELLEALQPEEWARSGQHADSGRYSVDDWLGIYASHPHDHAAQIRRARGWEIQLDVPGGSLFVQREGSGTPVLLLHAGIADSRSWDALVPLLTEAGHHVIRYDRRGYGRSITQDVPFSDRADALAVLDALGTERAVFVGNSMGGMVAIDTAIESRGRVAAVVAVAAGVSGYGPEPTPAESELFDEMDRLEAGGDADAIAAFDVMVWVNGPGQPAERAPAHVREAVLEMDRGLWDPPRTKGQSTRLEPRAAGRLQELTVPVVALAGELDLTETWTTARYLEEHAPQAHAVLLPGVAHMIGMEMPAELARHITELSRSIPDR